MRINVKGTVVSNDDAWIYDWFGEEYISPAMVHAALEEAGGEMVDVDINSGGGSVFAGSEIYEALRTYDGGVKIHVVGIAASAASVIACAGKSDIAPTAQIMVHNVSSRQAGNYHDMEKMADILKQANRSIAAAYVEKTGMSEQDALDLMDAETWLTANDAVEYGLIDSISAQSDVADNVEDLQLTASYGGTIPISVINKMQERKHSLIDYFS